MGFDPMVTVMAADKINLSKSWDSFFSAIEKQAGPILNLAAVVGVLLVVLALIKWAWDRRRGGGMGMGGQGSGGAVWGSLLVGSLLAAPKIIIPMFLLVFDVIANAVIEVFYSTDGVKKSG